MKPLILLLCLCATAAIGQEIHAGRVVTVQTNAWHTNVVSYPVELRFAEFVNPLDGKTALVHFASVPLANRPMPPFPGQGPIVNLIARPTNQLYMMVTRTNGVIELVPYP